MVLYSTDNLIIINLLSSFDVTIYNISYKFFGLPFLIYTLYIATHWPAFIDALSTNNHIWVSQKIKLFKKLFLYLVITYVILFFLYDMLVPIWTANEALPNDKYLNFCMIIYYLVSAYTTIYIYVINASGKILLQKYIYILIAIINIPLSVLFVKLLNFGSAGVIMASTACLLFLLIIIPIQSDRILNKNLEGIWDK